MTRYNITITLLTIICIIALMADTDNILLLLATKLVALITGAAAYLLQEYWASQGKVTPITED